MDAEYGDAARQLHRFFFPLMAKWLFLCRSGALTFLVKISQG